MTEKKRNKVDSQLLIAIGVMIISLSALFVSIHQADIMNKQTDVLLQQTKASAWPHLEIELDKSESREGVTLFKIHVQNKGTGPAIIEGVRVSYDGDLTQDWGQFFQLAQVPDSIPSRMSNDKLDNSVLSANEDFMFVDLTINEPLMRWIYVRADKIKIDICYKSVFDEHWLISRSGFQTNVEITERQSVDSCSFKPEEVFIE